MGEIGRSKKEPVFQILKKVFSLAGEMSKSMRIKLFLILSMLISTIFLGVFVILIITGTFTAGLRETQREVNEQLDHTSKGIEDQYGQLSIQTVELSRSLSASIEKKLSEEKLTTANLKTNPEVLEKIVAGEYEKCMYALVKAKSSGVFMILDATVNPKLPDAEDSRAGLYIKNNEPNILNSSAPNTLILRGPSSIGRQNSITLHSQWRMEFDVSDAPYFKRPMEEGRNRNLSLSQLYYWSPSVKLPGTTEDIMLCSVPLIDSKGNVFGVCGLEVSAMLFKLSYMPDNNTYRRIFYVFAPYRKDILNTSRAFFAGGYTIRKMAKSDEKLTIRYYDSFNTYRQDDGTLFRGLHRAVKMYPKGSAFANEMWIVALMMPDKDISASAMHKNLQIGLLLGILLILGIIGSYFLSRRYIMPITKSIDIIKSNNFNEALKTNISEIDDLMEFLSNRGETKAKDEDVTEASGKNKVEKLPTSLFDEFVKNTKTLSPAERAVFNLYVEGYTAKEITGILSLSINTIKTHNKRIYMKLNVTSREELLLYVNMLKEAGRDMK